MDFVELIKRRLPNSRFARDVSVLAGGAALGQSLALLAAPLLTRLYSPGDFGVLAVYTSIIGLLGAVATLRYQLAIPLPETDEEGRTVLVLSLIIGAALPALVAVAVLVGGESMAQYLGLAPVIPFLWVIPLGLLGFGMYQALNFWAIRRSAFRQISKTKIYQGLGMVGGQLVLGALHGGPLGLLVGDVIGRSSGVTNLAQLAWRDVRRMGLPRWGDLFRTALRYRQFPLVSSFSALLNSAGLQVAPLLLVAYYGSSVAGLFALAQRLIGMPMTLVGQSIGQVYMAEAVKVLHSDPARLIKLFLGTARKLLFLGFAPLLLLAVGGPYLFSAVFGEAWFEAGSFVRILAGMFLLQFVMSPLSQTLNILECQGAQLFWDALRLSCVVGTLTGAHFLNLSPSMMVTVYSVAMFLCYGLLFFLVMALIRKKITS
jgi:O-antigen/teichoic acid export membrane protein